MDYPLCRLLGDTPRVKIMDVLLCKSPMELKKSGFSKYTDLSEFEIEKALSELQEVNLVEVEEGYYSYADTEKVKKLRQLYITELQRK